MMIEPRIPKYQWGQRVKALIDRIAILLKRPNSNIGLFDSQEPEEPLAEQIFLVGRCSQIGHLAIEGTRSRIVHFAPP